VKGELATWPKPRLCKFFAAVHLYNPNTSPMAPTRELERRLEMVVLTLSDGM